MWNTATGQCLRTAALEAAIISLSFHPSGNMLAIASGQFVYLWDYNVRNREKPESIQRDVFVIQESPKLTEFEPRRCRLFILVEPASERTSRRRYDSERVFEMPV